MSLVKVSTFRSRLEAETYGHVLDQYDIPFFVQCEDAGIFGMGASMNTPATLMVREEHLQQVKRILLCLFEDAENDSKTAE